MGEVVEGRAGALAVEVAEHEEVGGEEEDGEEEPACVEMMVGEEGEGEEGGFFDAEKSGWPGEHGLVIRVLGEMVRTTTTIATTVTAKAKQNAGVSPLRDER